MLVLSRRQGERIRINDDVVIQVLEISGGRARLSFEAPARYAIFREEIWLRIQEEKKAGPETK